MEPWNGWGRRWHTPPTGTCPSRHLAEQGPQRDGIAQATGDVPANGCPFELATTGGIAPIGTILAMPVLRDA
jgi:hypothetical protein